MAIRNINTIQNSADLTYLSYISDKYMYESLSNLGQRFSIAGDSISTQFFNTLSIINKDKQSFVDKYDNQINTISRLVVSNNKLYLQILDINNINNTPLYSEEIDYSVNNAVYTDSDLRLDIKINGIDFYKENMLIYLDNNEILTIVSLGSDNEIGIVELNIEKYNINTNTLVESLKIIDTNDDDNTYMYYVYDEIKKTNDTEYDYVGYKYKVNRQFIDGIYGSFSTYALSIYNSIVMDYYKTNNYIDINTIFFELLQNNYINCCPNIDKDGNNNPIEIQYNNQKTGLTVSNQYASDFNPVLLQIYNQWVYMYEFMFNYYCNYVYKKDNNQLNKYILYKIFDKIYKDSSINNVEGFAVYIPTDYQFDYYCKSNDNFFIYSNETPVNVLYTINSINQYYLDNLTENDIYNNNIILATSKQIEKIVLYKYNVNYNTKNTEIINNIIVNELYTTPYILDGYWFVNNKRTLYKAIGEDAGNPNIILLYTDDISNLDNEYNNYVKILSKVNTDILTASVWDKVTVNVNLFDNLNVSENTNISKQNYDIYCLIPTVKNNKSEFLSKLKHSLIINVSNINNVICPDLEKLEILNILGDSATVTTFWCFDETINAFVNIKDPQNNENSLTFSKLTNINNIIAHQTNVLVDDEIKKYDFNSHEFSYLLLSTNEKNLKNNFSIYNNFVVLYNNDITSSNNLNTTPNNIYTNKLMFGIKYINTEINDDVTSYIYSNKSNIFIKNDIFNSTLNIGHVTSGLSNAIAKEIGSDDDYSYDFMPSKNVPLFNLGEVFTINQNSLNRTNICSLDEHGDIYYSYIGVSPTDNDKTTLRIGTNTTNINIGTDSLLDKQLLTKFKKLDKISIDFNNIDLNAKRIHKPKIEITNIDDITYKAHYMCSLDLLLTNTEYNTSESAINTNSQKYYSTDDYNYFSMSTPSPEQTTIYVKPSSIDSTMKNIHCNVVVNKKYNNIVILSIEKIIKDLGYELDNYKILTKFFNSYSELYSNKTSGSNNVIDNKYIFTKVFNLFGEQTGIIDLDIYYKIDDSIETIKFDIIKNNGTTMPYTFITYNQK